MKQEHDSQTPVPTFSAAQWGSQVIDPALQQQSQQSTASYYQAHQQYYQQQAQYSYTYPAPQAAQQPVQAQVTSVSRTVASSSVETADVAMLNDALGSAGVDLRAEEETLQRTGPYDQYAAYRPYEDRSRKQPPKPQFDTRILGPTMRSIGTKHKVTRIPEDSVNYLALSLRARLQDLVTEMIAASAHRTDTQFDQPASQYEDGSPMWSIVVRSDVAKQLTAIERVEREEEMRVRRERRERAEAAAQNAALAAQASAGMAVDEDAEGGPKKKKKKEGPGVTARNMSEDARKKMSNAVASQAAGLGTGKYAWMTQANVAPAPIKPKPTTPTAGTPATTTAPAAGAAGAGRWARPYVPSKPQTQREEDNRRAITLRDALFVMEKEKGHGGGRGSARGWT